MGFASVRYKTKSYFRRLSMLKALIVYDTKTGNTKKMAEAIRDGIRRSEIDVDLKKADETSLDDLIATDIIVFGSPTYYCNMSGELKLLLDKTFDIHGKLENKLGAAFASSSFIAGGNETTTLAIIQAMLMHRMIIVGHQTGIFGAISIQKPDDKCINECRDFGIRIADIAKKLA